MTGATHVRPFGIVQAGFICAVLSLVPVPSHAQNRVAPATKAEIQASFSPVVKLAAPAVVNVYGARVEQRQQRTRSSLPVTRRTAG